MSTPLRILYVEDSPSDAKLVIQALRAGERPVEFERVDTEKAMRAALAKGGWDIVLSDWSMPKFSAPAALAVLKDLDVDLPFIIVSGTIGEEKAAEAMRAGAHDYVLKDRLARLMPAVERELREGVERAERRRAEALLRQSEARFRRLADSGLVGIVVADGTGKLREANDAFLSMIGHGRADLDAGLLTWERLTPPEWTSQNELATELLREHGVARPWERRYLHKSGSEVPALVGAATLGGDQHLSVSVDLGPLKKAEEGKRAAEEALRQTEEQFRQAQKMEAVGRLAGGVAHDFNNVLSVILSYGEILMQGLRPDDPMREDVAEIRKAGLRAAGLTKQLLTFSRHQVTEPRVIELDEVVVGLEKMVRRIVGEDIELTLRLGDVGRIRVDPTHLEQVIMNLVVNARDAMPTGGTLSIQTADVDLGASPADAHVPAKPGAYVRLSVTDSGCGMDRATQSRIFEPFFTTKEKGKGTGLGLSTVFGIVQQSGGTIGVQSAPGKGTTLLVYLPRVLAGLEPATSQVPPTDLGGTETILLVEDEAQVRAVVRAVLEKRGYHVLVAGHPSEALPLCQTHRGTIHLLLTDVVMPQMSGPELARRLVASRPEMMVLCMSGYSDDAILPHGVHQSGAAFLQKPFTPNTLATKVREVLDQKTPR